MSKHHSGGCQCGAVRYRVAEFGRSSICHCRMCQKAFGSPFGALVTAKQITWTRGVRSRYQSSNRNWRGFCNLCGTPLTYEYENVADEYENVTEVAVCTLDNPGVAPPVLQVNTASKLPFFDEFHVLPTLCAEEQRKFDAHNATIVANQHPDHDTEQWPPETESR